MNHLTVPKGVVSMKRFVVAVAAGLFCLALVVPVCAAQDNAAKPSLVERLGFAKDAKLLIVNGDDFGMNHSTNEGTCKALKSGGLTSATVMMPCGWNVEALNWAKAHPQASIGVHTTLTSEWGGYKWGPCLGVGGVPSLCSPEGYLWDDVILVYGSATIEDVEKEIRTQIIRAIASRVDITHIDSHMGTMQYNPIYHELYLKLAKEFNLPCRMAGHDIMDMAGGGYLIDKADEMGVLHPEMLYMDGPPSLEATESYFKDLMAKIPAGKVSELYIHAAVEGDEMSATTGSAKRRIADTDFFADLNTVKWMDEQGIQRISYRELRELQRTGKPIPRAKYGWEEKEKGK
jgi:predicted glycoside hydrolase/deacetylase ChbG (UPF0249 family)